MIVVYINIFILYFFTHVFLLDCWSKRFRYFTDIIVRLAQSSSESEIDAQLPLDTPLVEQTVEVDFFESLQPFQDTVPKYMKNKKANRQKKKVKKDGKVI